MKKILIISLVVAAIAVALFFAFRSNDNSPLVGHTFTFHYRAADQSDAAQKEHAKIMNAFGYSAEFINDSTFVIRTDEQIGTESYSIRGDSINFAGTDYLMKSTGQSMLLIAPDQTLELLPLR